MRFLSLLLGLCVLPVVLMAQTPDASPSTPVETLEMMAFEPTREEAVLEAYIDGIVSAHRRIHHTPGVTVSIVKDGKLMFAKGYGHADIEAGKAVDGHETLFRIGSVSKTFVWTSILMLAEQGRLDLDADVNEYLKGMTIPAPFGVPVTLNHLMAHRAGFEDTIGVFTYLDSSEVSLTQALIDDMPKQVYTPGTRTSYSNWGSGLATKLVEDVSGIPYEVFLQEKILTPLAMTKTTLYGPSIMDEALRANLAQAYALEGGVIEAEEHLQIGPYASVGAMGATASDMAQWMLLLLGEGEHDGVRLVSKQSVALMQARAVDDRPEGEDMAHGFMNKTYRGYETFGHGGATSAFYTFMQLVPDLDLGIFVSQSSTTDRTLISTLPDLVIDHLAAPGHGFGAVALNEEASTRASEYVGSYFGNRRSFTQFEKLFSTEDVAKVTAGKKGALILSRSKDQELLPLAGATDVFQDRYGKRVVFGRDADGKVSHFSGDTYSYERMNAFTNPLYLNIAFLAAVLLSLTTWLGAWRRWGHGVSQTEIGKAVGAFDFIAATCMFAFVVVLALALIAMSGDTDALLRNYPTSEIKMFRIFALFMFFLGGVVIIGTVPVWLKSGWSIWRKVHHTLFAASLGFLCVMFVAWNIIFAATA